LNDTDSELRTDNSNLSSTVNELNDFCNGERTSNSRLSSTINELSSEVSNMSKTLVQLQDTVNELNATLLSLQEKNAQVHNLGLTNLTIYISTDYNATAHETIQVWSMSLTVGEPFFFTRPINGTLDIVQNVTLVGSFLLPRLNDTKATFNLAFLASYPAQESSTSSNQTQTTMQISIGGPSTYEVLLDKPSVILYARVP
jgi:uncharacterized protein YukE